MVQVAFEGRVLEAREVDIHALGAGHLQLVDRPVATDVTGRRAA